MSDTQQLRPPRPNRASSPAFRQSAPQPWWRRIGAGVWGVSIAIHLLFALVAGYFIVQRFQDDPQPKAFTKPDPPRDPKVLVKQRNQSASAVRVVTTNPDAPFALPPMIANTEDAPVLLYTPAAGDAGTLTYLPPTGPITATRPYGNENLKDGLVGRFYDLKQDRARRPTRLGLSGYAEAVKQFVARGWDERELSRFYSSPAALGTYQFFIPNMEAAEGPAAFRMENKVTPTMWLAHYKGTVIAPETGRYRFVGAGDDVMLVGFDGRLVLDRCWNIRIKDAETNYDYGYTGIPGGFARGDAIDVVKGRAYPIDVLIGEQPGGKMFAFLLIEKEGGTYRADARGNPILPVFRVKNARLPEFPPGTELPPYDPDAPAWSVWPVSPQKR